MSNTKSNNDENTKIDVKENSEIIVKNRDAIFGVEQGDWDRIKKMVKEIKGHPSRWESASWFNVAATLSFFIAWVGIDVENKYRIGFLVAAFFTSIIASILFLIARTLLSEAEDDKKLVLYEMSKMEKGLKEADEK